MSSAVILREVGQYPLSIATSLAFESINDIHPDRKWGKVPIKDYGCIYVNLKTLFRNMVGATVNGVKGAKATEFASELLTEMGHITDICVQGGIPKECIKFYINNYVGVDKISRHAAVRRDNTAKQVEYTEKMVKCINTLLENINSNSDLRERVEIFPLYLKPKVKLKTLILTHNAFDLVGYRDFGDLVLVESHTGNIKDRSLWYTKYMGKDLPVMPWNVGLLMIFGDSETFRPMDIKLKRDVIERVTEDNWSAITTRDKMKWSLGKIQNPMAKEVVLSLI